MCETATVSKGDVTIRLASTGEQATTSSKLLPLTSLVFEAMLCPNFAEGAQLEKTVTIEITPRSTDRAESNPPPKRRYTVFYGVTVHDVLPAHPKSTCRLRSRPSLITYPVYTIPL
jgi:hypothetical protein